MKQTILTIIISFLLINFSISQTIEYQSIGEFGEIGQAWAFVKKDNKYGCIDTDGKVVVPIEYQSIGEFGEIGQAWAFVKKDNKYGCIDTNGKVIVPIQHSNLDMININKN